MADSSYIPFDFGTWTAQPDQPMICAKHGPQDGGLALRVVPKKDEPPITRNYCGQCVIEALDRATAGWT